MWDERRTTNDERRTTPQLVLILASSSFSSSLHTFLLPLIHPRSHPLHTYSFSSPFILVLILRFILVLILASYFPTPPHSSSFSSASYVLVLIPVHTRSHPPLHPRSHPRFILSYSPSFILVLIRLPFVPSPPSASPLSTAPRYLAPRL